MVLQMSMATIPAFFPGECPHRDTWQATMCCIPELNTTKVTPRAQMKDFFLDSDSSVLVGIGSITAFSNLRQHFPSEN